MEELLVIKIGGNIIDDDKALNTFISDFAGITKPKILIHGGGKLATELSSKLGIATKMENGRRITDAETLKMVTMTYAGWINKNIVALLQSSGCSALGLCGADAKIIPAIKRPVKEIDYGLVGDIQTENVNTDFLKNLLRQAITPVIAPISADDNGQLLNVNADTIAAVVAGALGKHFETTLIYCFEKNGLLRDVNDENSIIPEINESGCESLKSSGVISKGMIPKIDNAFAAIKNGVKQVVIGHAGQIKEIAKGEKEYGTYIHA